MGWKATFVPLVGVALALLSPHPSTAATWNGPPIDPKGWTEIGADDSLWVSYKPARPRADAETARIWERVEFSHADVSSGRYYLSTVSLLEFDCLRLRERAAQTTIYELNNLLGVIKTDGRPDHWTYPEPGSYGDDLMSIACRDAARADTLPRVPPER